MYALLDLINEERRRVGARELRMTPRLRLELHELSTFIVDNSLDPGRWIKAVHLQSPRAPSVKAMMAASTLARFREWLEGYAAREVVDARLALRVQDDINHAKSPDLSPLAEQAKRVYQSEPELCRAQARSLTLGWNPRSRFCGTCTQATACEQDLPRMIRDARRAGVRSEFSAGARQDVPR